MTPISGFILQGGLKGHKGPSRVEGLGFRVLASEVRVGPSLRLSEVGSLGPPPSLTHA